MVNEFKQIAELIIRLNRNTKVLRVEEVNEVEANTVTFKSDRKQLLGPMKKLADIEQEDVNFVITHKIHKKCGPISTCLVYIDIALSNYEWQFYTMKNFLKPLAKYYKQKARRSGCPKEFIFYNPILMHSLKVDFESGISEIEQLVELIDRLNNYLGDSKLLTEPEVKHGYVLALALSAMSCDLQEILYNLKNTDNENVCTIDSLLRKLYGKIAQCYTYISWLNDNLTRKMVSYPDCYDLDKD